MTQRRKVGDVLHDGSIAIKTGNTTTQASCGGLLYVNTSQFIATFGAGDETAYLYTVPANTLNTNGQSIWYEIMTYNSSITGGSRSRLLINGSVIYTHNHSFNGSGYLYFYGRMIRAGATSLRHSLTLIGNISGVGFYPASYFTTLTITLSSSFNIEFTVESSSGSDTVLGEFIVVGFNGV